MLDGQRAKVNPIKHPKLSWQANATPALTLCADAVRHQSLAQQGRLREFEGAPVRVARPYCCGDDLRGGPFVLKWNKIQHASACGTTLVASVSFTFQSTFRIHKFGGRKLYKKNPMSQHFKKFGHRSVAFIFSILS